MCVPFASSTQSRSSRGDASRSQSVHAGSTAHVVGAHDARLAILVLARADPTAVVERHARRRADAARHCRCRRSTAAVAVRRRIVAVDKRVAVDIVAARHRDERRHDRSAVAFPANTVLPSGVPTARSFSFAYGTSDSSYL